MGASRWSGVREVALSKRSTRRGEDASNGLVPPVVLIPVRAADGPPSAARKSADGLSMIVTLIFDRVKRRIASELSIEAVAEICGENLSEGAFSA